MQRQPQDMDADLFHRIIDELEPRDSAGELRLVVLHLFGEPLVDRRFFDLARHAAERLPRLRERVAAADPMQGLSVSTNAVFLDDWARGQILHSGLTWVGLSLDGTTKHTYEQLRRGASFEQVVDKVRALLALNARHPGPKPNLGLQILRTKTTEKELAAFEREWREASEGQDNVFVWVKQYTDWAGQVADERFADVDSRPWFVRTPCISPFQTLAVCAGGEVTVCCYDVDCRLQVGDARRESLGEIWHGERLARVRRAMLRGAWRDMPLCARCQHSRTYLRDVLFRRRGRPAAP